MTVQPPRSTLASAPVAMATATATLLPGGQVVLVLEGTGDPVPQAGLLISELNTTEWTVRHLVTAHGSGRWSGLAILPVLPGSDCLLFDAAGERCWRIDRSGVGASARFLVAAATAAGLALSDVVARLGEVLGREVQGGGASVARSVRSFVLDLLEAVSERAGFVEVLAEPTTGGMFLQGWALALDDRPLHLIGLGALLSRHELKLAFFARPDLLEPSRGICLYGLDIGRADILEAGAAFLEQGGRILRLDLVPSAALPVAGPAATEHITQMLPRLTGEAAQVSAFRRIVRPRYAGLDTLSASGLPIALGLDSVLRAPDGTILVTGWLLDPERRVAMALIKSLGNRYGRISDGWVRLPRPDLHTAFAADPRFQGRLDPHDDLHGFIARVPPAPTGPRDPDVYAELVLDDESCLFVPLRPAEVAGLEQMSDCLSALSPTEPQLARIIDAHLVGFLAALEPVPAAARRPAMAPPVRLGERRPAARVAALMPVDAVDDLQPVLALLAGTEDAAALDLTVMMTRALINDCHAELQAAFRFYGIAGQALVGGGRLAAPAWCDAAVAQVTAEHVLYWSPRALPKRTGWLALMLEDLRSAGRAGALSPALTHEDGSIAFGPPSAHGPVVGFPGERLPRGEPLPVPCPSPDIALFHRAALAAAGGFAGHLLTDAHAHVDLGARLRGAGHEPFCSGRVEFWKLGRPPSQTLTPQARLLRRIDARLLAHRGLPDPEEWPA